jgi:hypothetical protein
MTFGRIFIFSQIENPIWRVYPQQSLLAILALNFGLVVFATLLFDQSNLIDRARYEASAASVKTFFIKEMFLDVVRGEIHGATS